jgi:hypothetical protein
VSGAILAFAVVVSCGHAEENASYGTHVKYRASQKIDFPDFTVEYLGRTPENPSSLSERISLL